MKRVIVLVVVLVTGAYLLSGCTTVPKKYREDVQNLKGRVETLESRVEGVEGKQDEMERPSETKAQGVAEAPRKAKKGAAHLGVSPKSRTTSAQKDEVRELQTLLKNAGYYTGTVDGVKGRATKRAIKAFQKANGLTVDGVAGSRTMELLRSRGLSGSSQGGGGAVK